MAFPKSRLSSSWLRLAAPAIRVGSAGLDGLNGLPSCPAIFNSSSVGARLKSSALRLIFLGVRCVVVCTRLPLAAVDCTCLPDPDVPVPAVDAIIPRGDTHNSSKRRNVTSHLEMSAVDLATVAIVLWIIGFEFLSGR